MATGTVKSYHHNHGYGAITPDDGGPEHIVYADSIIATGEHLLAEGQKVEFDATLQEGRPVAEHVRVVG